MLELLAEPGVYERLDRASATLHEGLVAAAQRHGVPVYGTRAGSMGTLFFTEGPVVDYAAARASDTAAYARFFNAMLERGIYLAPAQYEAVFLSTAHDDAAIDATLRAAEEALATVTTL
jgi:glutamate-1-semialdehyde 2,1-aminomutase